MRIFATTDHDAHYPVGCASVVVAADEAEARKLLDAELAAHGLKTSSAAPYHLREIAADAPAAFVLHDGDY